MLVIIVSNVPTAPSSPPLNSSGEVLSPSTLFISWQPPALEEQNGIITSYSVLLTEVPTNTTTTYQRDSSHTEILITDLHPHYEYSCSVAAWTSAGLGPYGTPFTVTTHHDGECMLVLPYLSKVILSLFHSTQFTTPECPRDCE